MGLMSYIHKLLLRRGALGDILPDDIVLDSDDKLEREAAKADVEARVADEKETSREVAAAIRRLHALNRKNHYGESLRQAFGGK